MSALHYARKEHICDACGELIKEGHEYVASIPTDPGFFRKVINRKHPACHLHSVMGRLFEKEKPPALTEQEAGVLRHALGLNSSKIPFRNHYAADPAGPAGRLCESLCERGVMHNNRTGYYRVSIEGGFMVGVDLTRFGDL